MPAPHTALLAAIAVLASAAPSQAAFLNAGFESGFTSWTTRGDASVVGAGIGVTPREGALQAFLTTASVNGDTFNFSGTDAVSAADLESFLGLAGGTIGAGYEGTALRQLIVANAGDVLTFDYKFLTTEGADNDFAFVTLGGYQILADTTASFSASGVVLDPAFGDPTRETDWRTFTYTFTTSGTFTLGIGVADANDEFLPSALIIDNGSLGPGGSVTPVPGPGGLVLAVVGGACLGLGRLRRRKSGPA